MKDSCRQCNSICLCKIVLWLCSKEEGFQKCLVMVLVGQLIPRLWLRSRSCFAWFWCGLHIAGPTLFLQSSSIRSHLLSCVVVQTWWLDASIFPFPDMVGPYCPSVRWRFLILSGHDQHATFCDDDLHHVPNHQHSCLMVKVWTGVQHPMDWLEDPFSFWFHWNPHCQAHKVFGLFALHWQELQNFQTEFGKTDWFGTLAYTAMTLYEDLDSSLVPWSLFNSCNTLQHWQRRLEILCITFGWNFNNYISATWHCIATWRSFASGPPPKHSAEERPRKGSPF